MGTFDKSAIGNDFTSLNLLLVDDASFVRSITAKIFRDLGFSHVLEADNGEEAISILNHYEMDLLVTDIQMPEMNGIELIKQIRTGKTPQDRGLIIVVETSFSNNEVIGSCLSLDINGFMVKPFTPERVKDKISNAFSEHKSLRSAIEYESVKTDLASLARMGKQEQTKASRSVHHNVLRHNGPNDKRVKITALKPGMKLLEDLNTHSGMTMLDAGRVLNEGLINRILELQEIIPASEVWVELT